MGGIQSISALPDDLTFNQKDNHYDISSYKRICAEFGVDPSSDFRFTHGKNKGLGNVCIWVTYEGHSSTDYNYPDQDLALFDDERVTDRKDSNYRANGIYFVRNDQGADRQFEYFVPDFATRAHTSRVFPPEPVNRGLCVLCSWRTGQCPQQHFRRRWAC